MENVEHSTFNTQYPKKRVPDKILRRVAQDCILLYRGFEIRNRLANTVRV